MNLKKILVLAMLALLTLPSLTMVVRADPGDDPTGDPNDGAGLAGAIERASLYLENVRNSAENTASLYPEDHMIHEYLNEIYDLLGRYDGEDPEILLQAGTNGIAEESDLESHSGTYSVHLETTGALPTAPDWSAAEARIVIPMPEGFTLGELNTISWWTYLVSGYIPHVDIFTEVETLVAEGAHVNNNLVTGWATGTWFNTFEGATGVYTPDRGITGSTSLLTTVNSETAVWFSSGSAATLHTLGDFQIGTLVAGMNESTVVTKLEIEIDNWVVQSEAYVDDIKIDGVTYDFEEKEEEDGQAKYYLDQASACLGEGDFNSAARNLAAARNILGRVKGLLNSMVKVHKVTRTQRFMEQVEHRIEGIVDKVDKLSGRLGEGKANKFKASMGLAKGKLRQLEENLTGNNVDSIIDELENTTEIINKGFDELEEEEPSYTLEAMDRLEAHIRVLKASAERLRRKGCDTTAVDDELENAETLLSGMMNSLEGGNTEEAEIHIEETDELVSDAKDKLKEIRKQHQNKGSKGKGKGQGN